MSVAYVFQQDLPRCISGMEQSIECSWLRSISKIWITIRIENCFKICNSGQGTIHYISGMIRIAIQVQGGGSRVVVSTAAFHARVRGSVPGLGGLKEAKMFLPHPRVKVNIVGSLRDREVACSASDRQGSNFESCVWRTVSSQSSHHPQEVLLAQSSLYVHKGGLKPDSLHYYPDPIQSLCKWGFRGVSDPMLRGECFHLLSSFHCVDPCLARTA